MRRGELFILSAPSGAGKTTLVQTLLERGRVAGLGFSVSHTTRPPRPGEVGGVDYHFVSPATFDAMIEGDELLEWARVHGNLYGTSREAVLPQLDAGTDVMLDIDVQGAEQVRHRFPGVHSIFVLPPSYEALRERLLGRASESSEQVERRLANGLEELARYPEYDYLIVNDEVERAADALAAVILEKRQRRERLATRAREILNDFERAVGTQPTARENLR